jgi:rhodanese-related sulfurtransferase/predicted enzyme related to lactoylglutathione lyase
MGKLTKGFRALLDDADRVLRAISTNELAGMLDREDVVVVDVRETEERTKSGHIPGSVHAPRGNLEFFADPDSPYHKPVFAGDKLIVTHCASGWRSALAAKTLQDMGFTKVAHLAGGFKAWQAANLPVQPGTDTDATVPAGLATGIGGVFFKARDPKALAAWYQKHLGLPVMHDTIATLEWRESARPHASGYTVWSTFSGDTKYFNPGTASFMINYRVQGLDRLLDALRKAGVTVFDTIEEYDYGRFAWCLDAEGNKVELWEPTGIKPH